MFTFSRAQPDVKPDVGSSEHINLKVTGQVRNMLVPAWSLPFITLSLVLFLPSFSPLPSPLQDGSVVHFKIKKNTPLRKLMNAYCERQGFQKNAIRFMFDGNPIDENQTPLDVSLSSMELCITYCVLHMHSGRSFMGS